MQVNAKRPWQCNPAYYDANDGCDCGCGIPDPDCDKPRQRSTAALAVSRATMRGYAVSRLGTRHVAFGGGRGVAKLASIRSSTKFAHPEVHRPIYLSIKSDSRRVPSTWKPSAR